MNNSLIAIDNVSLEIETPVDNSPKIRQQETKLAKVVEALKNISTSNFWKIIQQEILTPELDKVKNQLHNEKDTTEMFRLQGKIRWGEKFDLNKLYLEKVQELQSLRTKLTNGQDN